MACGSRGMLPRRGLVGGGRRMYTYVRDTRICRRALVVEANVERSNTTTKKRLSGPPGLPPINTNDGGGGGGGWDGGKIARNLALNALFLGIYFLVDSGGGGIFGGGSGSGGGGGGGGGGNNFGPQSGEPQLTMRELGDYDDDDEERRRRRKNGSSPRKKPGKKSVRKKRTAVAA